MQQLNEQQPNKHLHWKESTLTLAKNGFKIKQKPLDADQDDTESVSSLSSCESAVTVVTPATKASPNSSLADTLAWTGIGFMAIGIVLTSGGFGLVPIAVATILINSSFVVLGVSLLFSTSALVAGYLDLEQQQNIAISDALSEACSDSTANNLTVNPNDDERTTNSLDDNSLSSTSLTSFFSLHSHPETNEEKKDSSQVLSI